MNTGSSGWYMLSGSTIISTTISEKEIKLTKQQKEKVEVLKESWDKVLKENNF